MNAEARYFGGMHWHRFPIGTASELDAEPDACEGESMGIKSSWQAGRPRAINGDGVELLGAGRGRRAPGHPGHNCALEGFWKLRSRRDVRLVSPAALAWLRHGCDGLPCWLVVGSDECAQTHATDLALRARIKSY